MKSLLPALGIKGLFINIKFNASYENERYEQLLRLCCK